MTRLIFVGLFVFVLGLCQAHAQSTSNGEQSVNNGQGVRDDSTATAGWGGYVVGPQTNETISRYTPSVDSLESARGIAPTIINPADSSGQ